jgi:hypothetical protein
VAIRPTNNSNEIVLGDPFFRSVIAVFDKNENQVGLLVPNHGLIFALAVVLSLMII